MWIFYIPPDFVLGEFVKMRGILGVGMQNPAHQADGSN